MIEYSIFYFHKNVTNQMSEKFFIILVIILNNDTTNVNSCLNKDEDEVVLIKLKLLIKCIFIIYETI